MARLTVQELDKMAAELVGIEREITPGSSDDIYTEAAVEIARALLLEVQGHQEIEQQWIALVAFVMGEHEFDSDSCGPTPGVDCYEWCKACKLLAGLPSEVLEAATAKRLVDEIATH